MVNTVILIGRLGKDPETKYTPAGDAVTTFGMATDETWNNKAGEKQTKTQWHNIVTYRKLAEICGQYLTKGSLVYIEGKLNYRKWDDKEGVKHYMTEIIADNMKMVGSKGERTERSPGDDGMGPDPSESYVPF